LRLSPLIPFNLSNYFYGITAVSLKAYVAISAVGMIPGTLLYAYLGAIGKAEVRHRRQFLGRHKLNGLWTDVHSLD